MLRIRRALKSIQKHRCFYYSLLLLLILQYFFLLNVTLGNPVLFSNVLRTTRHNVNCYVSTVDYVKHITLVALVALYRLYVIVSFLYFTNGNHDQKCLSVCLFTSHFQKLEQFTVHDDFEWVAITSTIRRNSGDYLATPFFLRTLRVTRCNVAVKLNDVVPQ